MHTPIRIIIKLRKEDGVFMETLNALLVLVDVHVADVEGSYEVVN